jgi:predicted nucleic acid-binding protein
MILLDTSVVIDLFRAQNDRILDVILEQDWTRLQSVLG